MELSERIGEWFHVQMTALAMVDMAEEPEHQHLEMVMIGQAVSAAIRATLAHPEWAHQLARALDEELPVVSTTAWARRFASEFGAT